MEDAVANEINSVMVLGAFVIAACALALALVTSAIHARENRMQVIMAKLLDQDMATQGSPSEEVLRFLIDKQPEKPSCTCSGRATLIATYRRLRTARRIIEVTFLLFLTSSVVGFFITVWPVVVGR